MEPHRIPLALNGPKAEALRAEQLFLVLNIIKKASSTLDLQTFFRLLVETVYREVKAFSHVSVFEWRPESRRLVTMAVAGEGQAESVLPPGATPAGAPERAIATGAAFVCNDVMREARGTKPMTPRSRSVLCIPIRSGERFLALLNIESHETDVFGPTDVALFEILCEHLANVLQGVRLYDGFRRKGAKIQSLTEISRRVLGAASLDEALGTAVRSVVEAYGYHCACVALVGEDGLHLEHRAHYARSPVEVPRGRRQEIGRGVAGRAARLRRTVCCNDTAADPDHVPLVPGVRSELCIPLLAGETLVGMLDVNAAEAGAFDEEDVSLMETLAGQLALIVEKARYLESTERTRDYLESLVADAGDGILTIDASGRITRWNRVMERLLGWGEEEALGRDYLSFTPSRGRGRAGRVVSRALAGETIEGVHVRVPAKRGRAIDLVLTLSPVRGRSQTVEGVTVIARDVTERRRMERRFQAMNRRVVESKQKLADMVEKAHDAIFLVAADTGGVVQVNARAEAFTGFPRAELLGRPLVDLHPAQERERARRQLEGTLLTGAGPSVELSLLRSSGAPLAVEVTSSILRHGERIVVQWFCRDVSERLRARREKEDLQALLLQTEKLSALGQLISGVAHELNNPLTGVIGYSQLLASQECEDKIKRGLERVYAEARRCHRIVQNLLTFARKHTPEKHLISVNDIIESTIELRSYQLRVDNVRVETNLSRDLPRTMADFHQLQQVLMNILNNAHQAIKEAGRPGCLTLRSWAEGGRIRIEVADDGPGIPPENIKRIFDPFFTTKQTGQGTGLGLSICYGIIQEHDGNIEVRSAPGEGTAFTIDLPAPPHPPGPPCSAGLPAGEGSPAPGPDSPRGARVLVVDDEPSIVDVLCEALRAEGHEVDSAVNGRLALKKIRESPSYDAVLSDLKMPGMSGQDLFEAVSRIEPRLARTFVFSTGDVVSSETHDFLQRAGRPWVEKPFDVSRVVRLLEQVLTHPGGEAQDGTGAGS